MDACTADRSPECRPKLLRRLSQVQIRPVRDLIGGAGSTQVLSHHRVEHKKADSDGDSQQWETVIHAASKTFELPTARLTPSIGAMHRGLPTVELAMVPPGFVTLIRYSA